jgi:hypothetical protein
MINNDNYVVTSSSQMQFWLTDVHHRELEENETAGIVTEASSTISENSCCGLYIVL